MKKFLLYYAAFLFFILLYSCNGDQAKNQEKSGDSGSNDSKLVLHPFDKDDTAFFKICDSAGGLANFLVLKQEALKMMGDFDYIYKEDRAVYPVNALLNNYWLNAREISDIAQYLKQANKYDGVRIYMACALDPDEVTYKNQAYQNECTVFIFPTIKRNPPLGNPLKTDHQTDQNSQLHTMPYASKCRYIKEFNVALPFITKFDELYRKNPMMGEKPQKKDALSKSVWVDSCVIYALDRILTAYSAELDGANIILGAYSKKNPKCPSQLYPTQSTILLVPTNRGGAHQPNWDIIDLYTKRVQKIFGAGGFNHGELCPQQCE